MENQELQTTRNQSIVTIGDWIITMILMMFMLPAGIMDGVLACSSLILILTQYFGDKKIVE